MNESYDVAVIGAGIVGVSTAMHLLMRGMKVALIDRRGAGEETSYGNAGLIENYNVLPYAFPAFKNFPAILGGHNVAARLHYPSLPNFLPWFASLYKESQTGGRCKNGILGRALVKNAVEEHRNLMRGTDAERYLVIGKRARLCRSAESFAKDNIERIMAQELGIPFEILTPMEFKEIEPHVNPVYHKAIRWTGSGRLTNPGAVVKAYAERFTREGGTFMISAARNLRRTNDNNWNIETDKGEVAARHTVICGGPWSTEIIKPLGYNFPMRFKRGYHRHFAAIGGATLEHTLVDADIGYLLSPMEQGYRITTGAEFANLDAPPNPVQVSQAFSYASKLFPLGEPVDNAPWMGSRPCFADSLPMIGAAPKNSNLWFNFGHGHLGITMGPSSGRLLAEMITGQKTFCDPAPFSPGRFA